jgi:cytoskeletal protein CcmA (bactofilin family)
MFRRNPDKDNSLFDNAEGTQEASATHEASTSTTASTATPQATTTTASATTQSTAPISRPIAEPRTTTQTAGSFRSNAAALTGDRGRMPEAKTIGSAAGVGVDKANKTGRRVLTVGNDILLKGEIATCDRLVIEGKVDATLNDVHTVEIAETGSFKGSANIEDAEISGLFEGDLVVRNRLVIYATGRVYGKITYGEIEIERGGEISGEIKTTSPASSSNTTRTARKKEDDKVAA